MFTHNKCVNLYTFHAYLPMREIYYFPAHASKGAILLF